VFVCRLARKSRCIFCNVSQMLSVSVQRNIELLLHFVSHRDRGGEEAILQRLRVKLGLNTVAVLMAGQGPRPPTCESSPCGHYKIGCKIAKLHNSCTHSMISHSWCQITPLISPYITSSGIFGPKIQKWPPRWPRQTSAARNAPDWILYHSYRTKTIISQIRWRSWTGYDRICYHRRLR